MTSNDIRFDCRHRGDGGPLAIVPLIDGALLTELIDGFEIAAGMQPAGDAYGGLIPEFFRFGPMQDHFLGRSTNAMGPKTPVLGCECGEWGCWPLMARITPTADFVTWDAFEQPHRKTRNYVAFGPFQFDRHQYDDTLQALSAVIGSDVHDTCARAPPGAAAGLRDGEAVHGKVRDRESGAHAWPEGAGQGPQPSPMGCAR
ncbi:hypothetical protein [Streptomyces camelliae]|uniref:Uncharacterized protein n=1 Tax=Streptomyces camelliae TaxID=3004093 RepID=A0ABY7PE24_9ACTN|nr:hypothetical protein [Streptomyces sp. HUAS 2-6]WBO68873.1 hypothetical protein O1G22_41850 [Streptomyces sp. HUAS 2-6]